MRMAGRPSGSVAGFLAMAFVIVGLAGIFGTFAAPAPLGEALGREAVLDQVLVAAEAPDAAERLAALKPKLGASAAAVLEGPGTLAERVARERAAITQQFEAEARQVGWRLRFIIGVVTVAGAIFGFATLGFGRGRG